MEGNRMNVAAIMTTKPVTIRHDGTLGQALEMMENVGCRHLPVISAESHLIGIVSDRDCRLALNSPHVMRERWQDEAVTNRTFVSMIMTPAPIVVEPDTSIYEATRLMLNNHISALPVMRGETLVGIITTSDLLMAYMRETERALVR
ncbi:MAG: hypothetical protein OHK0046_15010 [Anaerolineae bacterium]